MNTVTCATRADKEARFLWPGASRRLLLAAIVVGMLWSGPEARAIYFYPPGDGGGGSGCAGAEVEVDFCFFLHEERDTVFYDLRTRIEKDGGYEKGPLKARIYRDTGILFEQKLGQGTPEDNGYHRWKGVYGLPPGEVQRMLGGDHSVEIEPVEQGGFPCIITVPLRDKGGPCDFVPALSQWGVAALTLLLLTFGKLYFGRRGRAVR